MNKFTKDKILKHLEELIAKVIIGALHHGMMVMLGPKYFTSSHDPNVFLNEDSFSGYTSHH